MEIFSNPNPRVNLFPKTANSLSELLLGEAYPRNDITELNVFLHLLDDDIAPAPYQGVKVGSDANRWYAPYTWQSNMYDIMGTAGEKYTKPL